jgi:hypothetical protein
VGHRLQLRRDEGEVGVMNLRQRIVALRATIVAAQAQLAAIEADMELEAPAAPPEPREVPDGPCQHPVDRRSNRVATFGAPDRWQCRDCGFISGDDGRAAAEG